MCKAMGMNTICIYIFWNYHEQVQGNYDFTGQADVAEFVRLIQKTGCIVLFAPVRMYAPSGIWADYRGGCSKERHARPEPVVYGKCHQIHSRRANNWLPTSFKMAETSSWFRENEYAVWGKDVKYMSTIRDEIRKAGFDKVQLLRCDWSSNFNSYQIDGVFNSLNFGAGA